MVVHSLAGTWDHLILNCVLLCWSPGDWNINFLLINIISRCLHTQGYCVVAKESVPKNVSVAFLERLKDDFTKRYGGGKADTALAKSLNKDYGPVIKQHMQYVLDHSEEIEKTLKVQAQVSEVKNIMLENIEKTLGRGEKLSELQDKTSDLRSQAQEFKRQGVKIRRKTWLQNMKIKLVVLGILLLLVIIVWVSVCQGFDCIKH
uniref:V-SNARE coiled-coil homology domain-containing protein n=1 Tax=Oryza brachyantha TaxID=4533 RepID=J3MJS1_ORYBR